MDLFTSILSGEETLYVIIRVAIILLLTFFAARLFSRVTKKAGKDKKIHVKFINNIVLMLLYVTGTVMALDQFTNFDKLVTTMLGASGIAALAVSLAAQESLGNAINGMFISVFRPFEVGDRIHLIKGNITGYIEDITLRHTVIRTFINSRVIIPNTVINQDMIENSNFWDGKASSFIDVCITYDSDMELARKIMLDVVTSHPNYVDTRPADKRDGPVSKVYVRNLSLYGVERRVSMWTDNVGTNFDACSDVRERIKQEFDRNSIQFAHSTNFDPMLTPPQ